MKPIRLTVLAVFAALSLLGCASLNTSHDLGAEHKSHYPPNYNPGVAPVTQPSAPRNGDTSRYQGQVY